jgi:hypothetical protein
MDGDVFSITFVEEVWKIDDCGTWHQRNLNALKNFTNPFSKEQV